MNNPLIEYLRNKVKGNKRDDIYENITYTFKSVYPDRETMEKI